MAIIGYCMKCKKKTEMKDTVEVTMKNGRKAVKGKCAVCGTGDVQDPREIVAKHMKKTAPDKGAVFLNLPFFF